MDDRYAPHPALLTPGSLRGSGLDRVVGGYRVRIGSGLWRITSLDGVAVGTWRTRWSPSWRARSGGTSRSGTSRTTRRWWRRPRTSRSRAWKRSRGGRRDRARPGAEAFVAGCRAVVPCRRRTAVRPSGLVAEPVVILLNVDVGGRYERGGFARPARPTALDGLPAMPPRAINAVAARSPRSGSTCSGLVDSPPHTDQRNRVRPVERSTERAGAGSVAAWQPAMFAPSVHVEAVAWSPSTR